MGPRETEKSQPVKVEFLLREKPGIPVVDIFRVLNSSGAAWTDSVLVGWSHHNMMRVL